MIRVARKPHGLSGRFEILKQYIVNAENGRWVAGAGLNEAKEALVFGTSAVQLYSARSSVRELASAMRLLAGTRTRYRRAHAAPLAGLISGRAKYNASLTSQA